MLAGDLGIWPAIVGIGDREEERWRIGEWNIEEEGSRATSNKLDI